MPATNMNRAERYRKRALEYLTSAYDDSFAALSYSDSSWAYRYRTVFFRSKRYGADVEVHIDENDDGAAIFADNYYRLAFKESAESFFTYDENAAYTVKVRFPDSVWSDELSGIDDFRGYLSAGKAIDVFYLCKGEWSRDGISQLVDRFCQAAGNGRVEFFRIKDTDSLDLNACEIDEIFSHYAELVVEHEKYTVVNGMTDQPKGV